MLRTRTLGVAAFIVSLLAAGVARADVIDGDWCSPDGKHLSIRGPEIVTPAGTRHTGTYTRHSFDYIVPGRDPNAGSAVAMRLINEETMQFRIGADARAAASAPMQIWHRCTTPITLRQPPARAG